MFFVIIFFFYEKGIVLHFQQSSEIKKKHAKVPSVICINKSQCDHFMKGYFEIEVFFFKGLENLYIIFFQ